MAEIRKIITAEEQKEKEEAERKKRLGRVEVAKLPSKDFSHAQVDDIVARMKERYEERGYGKSEGKGAELKKKVIGATARSLDQRDAKDLAMSKASFPRLIGTLYKALPFLNVFPDRFSRYSFAKNIPQGLEKANMNYSSKQYIAIASFASLLATFFASFLSLALAFTVFSPQISQIAEQMAKSQGPLLPAALTSGANQALFITGLRVFLSFGLVFIAGFVIFVVALLVSFQFPSNKAAQRGKAIDKELPFALRHMATEIKAGIGVHKTMKSLVEADYGELSVEFDRALRDIDKGVSTDGALVAMSERAPSENLSRAVMHMVRTLKTGGNLSVIIETLASDVAFELRMKMRDFVERLNLIGLFYMMVGIVFPVFVAVLAGIFNAIPTIGLAGMLSTEVLFLVYFMLIPMALSLILYIIKVMQPM